MSFAAVAAAKHQAGEPLLVSEAVPQEIISGWVGIFGCTSEELRLFLVLLPGDVLLEYPGCTAHALTPVRMQPTTRMQSVEPLVRHCFRLSQYNAAKRVSDFLFDTYCRLRRVGGADDNNYALPLTQEQMGELLGLSTVHINRTLKTLQPYFRVRNGRVYIDRPEQAAAFCKQEAHSLMH